MKREEIKKGMPFWPLGLPVFEDEWVVYGMQPENEKKRYIAVWHVKPGTETKVIPIPDWKGENVKIRCIYPDNMFYKAYWNTVSGNLSVTLPNRASARLFCIEKAEM